MASCFAFFRTWEYLSNIFSGDMPGESHDGLLTDGGVLAEMNYEAMPQVVPSIVKARLTKRSAAGPHPRLNGPVELHITNHDRLSAFDHQNLVMREDI